MAAAIFPGVRGMWRVGLLCATGVLGGIGGVAQASAGGVTAPVASGGAEYVKLGKPSVRRFSVSPAQVTSGARLPTIRLLLERRNASHVSARVVLWPVRGSGGRLVRLDLGRVRTGRDRIVRWPARTVLAPGAYRVQVHVSGARLARSAGHSGRASLEVRPQPVRRPRPEPRPTPPPRVVGGGVFPVAGAHTYPPGGEFGNDRGSHHHQGVDISAAQGVPVVAPVPGTVRVADFQSGGAGHYVVLTADDGREMFFAHLRSGSIVVRVGSRVAAGARLGDVGSTGRSSGPHLHFEIWEDGWRTSSRSHPIDPRPQLLAWDPDF